MKGKIICWFTLFQERAGVLNENAAQLFKRQRAANQNVELGG